MRHSSQLRVLALRFDACGRQAAFERGWFLIKILNCRPAIRQPLHSCVIIHCVSRTLFRIV
eukprot:COSAG05_NODE_16763_length_339_cov_0.858333_1_plen_60_part_01